MKKCPYCAEEIKDEAIVCRYCKRDLPPIRLQEDKERIEINKERTGNYQNYVIVGLTILAILIWALFYLINNSKEILGVESGVANSYEAKYVVTGTRNNALITYFNDQGGTEQVEALMPWEKTFIVNRGAVLNLVAQNKGSGNIICEIWIAGKLVKTSKTTAEYGVVTCALLFE